MAVMQFELRNHPAQARWFNPETNTSEPLFYDDGTPVPLIKDQKAVYLNGRHIAYCGVTPNRPLSFVARLPAAVVDAAVEYVTAQVGKPRVVGQPPEPAAVERAIQQLRKQQLDDDEFDDDEELEDTDTDLDEGR